MFCFVFYITSLLLSSCSSSFFSLLFVKFCCGVICFRFLNKFLCLNKKIDYTPPAPILRLQNDAKMYKKLSLAILKRVLKR